MMLVIRTQYMENYGTADEPYWKMKGGSEYKVRDARGSEEEITALVMALRGRVEHDGAMSREYILDWSMEADDYMSWFEKSQLELDGEIQFPEPELTA